MQAFSKLIIVENKGVLLAVDQHAADERVRLEHGQLATCACLAARAARSMHCIGLPPATSPQSVGSHTQPASGTNSQNPSDTFPRSRPVDVTSLNRCEEVLISRNLKSAVPVHLSPAQHVKLGQSFVQVRQL